MRNIIFAVMALALVACGKNNPLPTMGEDGQPRAGKVALSADEYITALVLVNTSTDEYGDISTLTDGITVTLDDPDDTIYGVRADITDDSDKASEIKSVGFALSGTATHTQTEHVFPYSLYGDSWATVNGDRIKKLHGRALPTGDYTLTVGAYDGKRLGGTKLGEVSVGFTVTDEEAPVVVNTPPPPPPPVVIPPEEDPPFLESGALPVARISGEVFRNYVYISIEVTGVSSDGTNTTVTAGRDGPDWSYEAIEVGVRQNADLIEKISSGSYMPKGKTHRDDMVHPTNTVPTPPATDGQWSSNEEFRANVGNGSRVVHNDHEIELEGMRWGVLTYSVGAVVLSIQAPANVYKCKLSHTSVSESTDAKADPGYENTGYDTYWEKLSDGPDNLHTGDAEGDEQIGRGRFATDAHLHHRYGTSATGTIGIKLKSSHSGGEIALYIADKTSPHDDNTSHTYDMWDFVQKGWKAWNDREFTIAAENDGGGVTITIPATP